MSSAKKQPKKHFDIITYSGDGSFQNIDGLKFSPDLVWIKCRSTATDSALFDSVRGTKKYLSSNTTSSEATIKGVTSFNSNGFILGNEPGVNGNDNYVAWCWNAGDETVTNNDGSTPTQVRSNPEGGFSIANYTVGSNRAQTIGHGLGSVPRFIIVKEKGITSNWHVYHESLGANRGLYLNTTGAESTNNLWDNTSPNSSVYSVRSGGTSNFSDGVEHIAYIWAEVPGYSSFGRYQGTGIANFVETGFSPAFVMIKRTDSSNDWWIYDVKRGTHNPVRAALAPNSISAEYDPITNNFLDVNSNGFTLKDPGDASNANGATYIYVAFAEYPTERLEEITTSFEPDVYSTWDRKQYDFAVGDNISQSSSGVVTTSEITDVTDNPDGTQTLTFGNNSQFGSLSEGDTLTQTYTASATVDSVVTSSSIVDDNMHGLRFDSARNTGLIRTFSSDVSGEFTYSFWVKPTKDNTYASYLYNGTSSADQFSPAYMNGTNIIHVISNNTPQASNTTLDVNVWQHIVIKRDQWNAIYISKNGGPWDGSVGVQNATIKSSLPTFISRNLAAPSDNIIDGYLSDLFFVDGYAVSPEEFAFDDGGTWKALPGFVVKDNINGYELASPYDTRPNYDQTWSDFVTADTSFYPDGGPENLFDGDFTTGADDNDSSKGITFTPPSTISYQSSVRVLHLTSQVTVTVTREDDSTTVTNLGGPASPEWFEIAAGPSTVKSIRFVPTDNNYCNVRALEIDGRLLLDGPANTSQVWSEYMTADGGFRAAQGPEKAFDGDDSESAVTEQSQKVVTIDLSSFNLSGTVSLVVQGIGASTAEARVNGDDSNKQQYQSSDAVLDFGDVGAINTIELIPTSPTAVNLLGVVVNGERLIDGAPQWNTSQVWSENLTGKPSNASGTNTSYSKSSAFNGNIYSSSYITNAIITDSDYIRYAVPAALAGKELRFYVNSVNDSVEFKKNDGSWEVVQTSASLDGTFETSSSVSSGYIINVGTDCTEFSLAISVNGQGSYSTGIYAVEADGEILVDKGSFGPNGFFLPFDPEADGVNYSSKTRYTGSIQGGKKLPDMFDGTLSTFFYVDGDITVTSAFGDITSVGVADTGNAAARDVEVNGSVVGTIPLDNSGAARTTTFTFSSVNANSITIKNGALNAVNGLYVNGVLLIDCNSIGVDHSGNNNNFHDENFDVGNTSQVWSNDLSGTGGVTNGPNAFDGNTSTNAGSAQSGAGNFLQINFTDVTVNNSLKLYCVSHNNLGVEVNGVATTFTNISGGDSGVIQMDGFTGELNTVKIYQTGGNTNIVGNCSAVYIDDVILIDANIQDTFTDTPMRNYAVLTGGANGNLVVSDNTPNIATNNITVNGVVGKSYYYEYNGIGVTIDGPVNGVSNNLGRTYNFGQQPFAATDVTYNQDTGIVILADTSPNTSEVWSESFSATDIVRPVDAFDGNLTTSSYSFAPITFSANLGNISTLEILVRPYGSSTGGETTIEGNGITTTVIPAANTMTIQSIPLSGGPVSNIVITVDNSGFTNDVSAIWADGRILVDADPTINNSQVWSDYVTGNYQLNNLTNGFDGDTGTNAECFWNTFDQSPPDGVHELIFTPPTPLDGPVEAWTNMRPEGSYFGKWQVDTGSGFGTLTSVTFPADWTEVVPAGQQLYAIRFEADHNGASFAAIRAESKILIDSQSQSIADRTYNVLREETSIPTQTVTYSDGIMIEEVPNETSFGDAGYKVNADATTIELINGSVTDGDTITTEEQTNSAIIKSIDSDNNQIVIN